MFNEKSQDFFEKSLDFILKSPDIFKKSPDFFTPPQNLSVYSLLVQLKTSCSPLPNDWFIPAKQ